MTPENKVKKELRSYLEMIGCVPAAKAALATPAHHGWYFMPVPMGTGVSGIADVIGHYKGRLFAIEVKAPGRRGQKDRGMSAHQVHQSEAIRLSGGFSMCFDGGEYDWLVLKNWVKEVTHANR